ncbi:MAG: UbiA family prenyltransferase, partial [Thioalkalispiraceae bacterium]
MVNSNLKTLCVDLDGTLVLTDCLHESIIQLLKQNLFYMFALPIWVLHGKAYFKDQIAKRVSLTAEFLPYNNSVLNYIKKRKSNTVEVYLVTASHQSIADNIAKHLGIFSGQFGSDSKHNYKGNNKAEFLDKQFGKGQYEYIGNDSADLSVWRHSGVATVASNNNNLLKKAKALGGKVNHIPQKYKLSPIPYIKMMRVHQWVKNTLIFLPLVLAHSFTDVTKLLDAFFGFILFSFAASGIYIFNDLVDLNHDRAHPVKSKRPLASGMVPVAHGLIVGGLLWIIALSTAYVYFDLLFFFILGYIILNFAYSTIFKK